MLSCIYLFVQIFPSLAWFKSGHKLIWNLFQFAIVCYSVQNRKEKNSEARGTRTPNRSLWRRARCQLRHSSGLLTLRKKRLKYPFHPSSSSSHSTRTTVYCRKNRLFKSSWFHFKLEKIQIISIRAHGVLGFWGFGDSDVEEGSVLIGSLI